MAFSWLRQHSILRSRFFIEARLFSGSTSQTYTYRIRNRLLPQCFNHESTMIRPLLTSSAIGTISISLNRERQTSVLRFSSKSEESHSYAYVQMPAVSQFMLGGTITNWMKKEGDKVENADNLTSVMEKFASKSDVNMEKSVNTNYEVEKKIPETSSVDPKDSSLPPHVVLGMPALSPTMDQGNITKWRKNEGDKLEVGDIICEIETDKATLEFESLEEGYIAKILVPEGSKDVLVGTPIVITVEDPEGIEALKYSKIGTGEANIPVSSHAKLEGHGDKTIFKRISPSAKLLIAEHGLDISSLKASGPRGTLLKGDILAAINAATKAPKEGVQSPPQSDTQRPTTQSPISGLQPGKSDSYVDIPNSQIRKIIARRLLESKQNTPHFYMSSDVILDPLLSFRKEINEKYGVKVSVNDIVIKIVSIALKNVPEAKAYWNVEKEDISLCDAVDISIAVATEKGLMTPIIRNADHKTLSAISSEVKLLAEKARSGKLAPNEFQGGSFSISNLGMFPVDRFCAIINPPQACILAVGRGNKVVSVVIGDDGVDKTAVVTKMSLTLSADHRVFDSRVGGLFLSELGENFNNIGRLLL